MASKYAFRFIVRIGNQYLSYVRPLRGGMKQLVMTPYAYDAADAGDPVTAMKLAVIVGGVAMKFDPILGRMEEIKKNVEG